MSDHHPHGHKFNPENWERLVSDDRRKLLDPSRFLAQFDVPTGATVADLGAGPGFFTFPLAERVGPEGSVYATDVSPEMLRVLAARGLPPQVHTVLADEASFDIPDGAVDFALLAFVLHELAEPTAFLREVARVLRPGGRFLVLEWKPQEEPIGPPLHERLAAERSAAVLVDGGFRIIDRGEANRSQYWLLAEPAA